MIKKLDRRSFVKHAVGGVVIASVAALGTYFAIRPLLAPAQKPVIATLTATLGAFRLKSDDFEDRGEIPPRFTCDGEDISPHLSWENPPQGTKSFALSLIDPDAPGGMFVHWLVYDIPGDAREIERGILPNGAKQVENDFGMKGYGGPCPPSGMHRYIFTLYALDVEHLEGVNRRSFFEIIERHLIGKAELTGLYGQCPLCYA
jgi:Raf kinase inhibitor-like YbhB/YbcL family protein